VEYFLLSARPCKHPDAQWLCSVLSPGESVSVDEVLRVMEEKSDDPVPCLLLPRFLVIGS
jgi:hypothetical protein